MSETQVIEGNREEVTEQLRHFPKEQRFRLIALPEAEDSGDAGPSLYERLAGRIGLFSFDPSDLSERDEYYFGKIMDQKYARDQQK